ncbi:MAG: 2-oxo acid dehydrogenase subunit E2, partial [Gemmatimonadetes bacterium]|nr:2-oxo acid dehydrogenase subunit E2 [Gemmatimonadota bacterium]
MLSIAVPPLGESIVEATVSRWLKKEGDQVGSGETLVELETDKVTVEVPALKAGVLTRRLKGEGDVVKVGELLGELDENATAGAVAAPVAVAPPAPAPAAPAPAPAPVVAAPPAPAPVAAAEPPKASPAAVRVAAEAGVPLGDVTGTGRGGVVSKPDVITHIASAPVAAPTPAPAAAAPVVPAAAPAPAAAATPVGRETREKMTTRRKRIAEHLLESQHATAHLTTFNEIDMTAVETLRARVNPKLEKEQGFKLSMMPFFVRAACIALKQYPVVNARIDGDHIIYHHYVNMGIAVASDAGLVVPNLKNA